MIIPGAFLDHDLCRTLLSQVEEDNYVDGLRVLLFVFA